VWLVTYLGLLLVLALEYMRPSSYIPGLAALRLNTIFPVIVLLASLWQAGRVPFDYFWHDLNGRLLTLLLGLIVVSVLTADLTMTAYNVFTAVLGYALMSWMITSNVTDIRRVKGVFFTLVVSHVVVAALTPEMFTDGSTRHYLAAGLFGDGNDFALSVNIAIPFALFFLFESSKVRQRVVWGIVVLFLAVCVIATQSRGGTLALGCLGLYYWIKGDHKISMGLTAALVVAAVLLFAPPAYFQRMNTISDTDEGSAQGRILAWTAGTQMALDHPLFGAGAGHFPVKYGAEYRPRGYSATEIPWQTAHSIYFLILGELGFSGLAVLLTFIFGNLYTNRRFMSELRGEMSSSSVSDIRLLVALSASLIAFAVGGAFLSATYYPHWYVLAGLLTASRRIIRGRLDLRAPESAASSRRPATTVAKTWVPRPRHVGTRVR
jgi:putative inorganic carbon (HCO3(-)) transporter